MRSEGRVRFLTIGTYMQMTAAAGLLVLMVWGIVTSYAYLTRDITLEAKNRTITNMSAQYQALSSDFSALEMEVERRAQQLETRQEFLEQMVGVDTAKPEMIAPLPAEEETPTSADEAAPATSSLEQPTLVERWLGTGSAQAAVFSNVDRRRMLLTRLKQMQDRQQLIASALLSTAESRMAELDSVLERTRTDKESLLTEVRNQTLSAGGPYLPEGEFQPIFQTEDADTFLRLMNENQRLELVSIGLESFPVGKPAADYYVSSRFGRRKDPFKKTRANHPGLDLAGWPGTAIMATAPGKIVHAGWYGPYGQMVEIEHGNGFRTRYGHMRKVRVKKGDIVEVGHRVGDMGKTGRATDTHVHYEVWFGGQVRDPMPYMKAANDVLEIQGRYEETSKQ